MGENEYPHVTFPPKVFICVKCGEKYEEWEEVELKDTCPKCGGYMEEE